jgi:predicted nucleic acid-binding protein
VPIRIYLDTSVLNRAFDDQTQARVHLETEAFLTVLDYVMSGRFSLINSAVLIFENQANPFPERQKSVQDYLSLASTMVNMTPAIRDRGRVLEGLGFKPIDALHIAAAEQEQAEVLVTCDDGLIKTAQRHAGILQVQVMSVLRFIAEEI